MEIKNKGEETRRAGNDEEFMQSEKNAIAYQSHRTIGTVSYSRRKFPQDVSCDQFYHTIITRK